MKREILPYNPTLKKYAKKLRKNMTLSEVLLWNALKQKKLGYDFDRQRPINEYIVDFYCKDLMLAIEVDGDSHGQQSEEDKKRQDRLEKLGVRFLRFYDWDVKNDVNGAIGLIKDWICRNGPTPNPSENDIENAEKPTPNPSKEGKFSVLT